MMEYKDFDIDFNLNNKVALVTGAAQGIGKAIVEMYAKKGANIILVDLLESVHDGAKDIADAYKVKTVSFVADITDKKKVENFVAKSIEDMGRIDILVNSAGIVMLDAAEKLTETQWDKTMDVNLKAVFLLSQIVGKEMIKNNYGKIINIASQAGIIALDNHIAYCVSKAGVISMTKVMAVEWAQYNVNVNAISPTVILTELGKKAWAGEVGEAMKKKIPVGRFGYPEEVAAAAVFLACDATNLMTGENMIIDGGYTIK